MNKFPIAYCPLPIAYYLLPIAPCPLPIAYRPLPIAHWRAPYHRLTGADFRINNYILAHNFPSQLNAVISLLSFVGFDRIMLCMHNLFFTWGATLVSYLLIKQIFNKVLF